MDTVQMYLAQLNKENIINAYYNLIKDEIENENKDISSHGSLYTYRNIISNFIDKLIQLDIDQEGNKGIILPYKVYDIDDFIEPSLHTGLIYENELKENKINTESYAYEFLPQSTIVGFYIANTKYANENIYDVVADIMYEASFFGYNEENKQKTKDDLNAAIEDIKNGKFKTVSFENYKKEFNIKENPKHDRIKMIIECNRYLYEKELKNVMDLLKIDY